MEYNNFQDNIYESMFNKTSENISNWIKENREKFEWAKDPNAYEMTNLFLFGAKYTGEGKEVNRNTLRKIWQTRSQDFANCNISENNFVYKICEDSYNAAMSGKPLVNDPNSHHALRKMAGIGLYIYQQQRDNGQINYDNPQELLELIECSSSLKQFHPNLYEKYAFDKNIDILCDLQLSKDLPQKLNDSITEAKTQLQKSNKEISPKANDVEEKEQEER